MTDSETAIKTTFVSIFGNAILAIIKASAGIFGNSFALVADAIESATDVLTSLLVMLGLKYAKRPADVNHPYGHGKIEPLVTFVVVAVLVTSAGIITYESIHHILTPHESPEAWTLYILGLIILWKEITFRYINKKSDQTHSTSLKADAWHQRSDALTSVAAFIGISVSLILGEGYAAVDDWAALFAAGFILYNSYLIFRPALGEIMDESVYDSMVEQIREVSITVEGIVGTEKCFIRKAGMQYHVELHAMVDGSISVKQGHDLSHRLKDTLKVKIPKLGQVLIHIEPENSNYTPISMI